MNSMNIRTELEILYSSKISTPSLCAFIKPKILIPILLYGFHKMKQDCEFSCDGQVISRLSEGENLK